MSENSAWPIMAPKRRHVVHAPVRCDFRSKNIKQMRLWTIRTGKYG